MAGKKRETTKAVSKKNTKSIADKAKRNILNKSSEANEEPQQLNGISDVEVHSPQDVITNGVKESSNKKKTQKITKKSEEIEVSNDKQATVKSKRINQLNEDEKNRPNVIPRKSVTKKDNARTKREQESVNEFPSSSSAKSKRKSPEEQTSEVKRKKNRKSFR